IERQFVGTHVLLFCSAFLRPHFSSELDKLLDYLGRLDALVRVPLDRLVQHFHEGLSLNEVLPRDQSNLVVQELLQSLERKVSLWHLLHFSQETFGQDGQLRFLYPSGLKDVYDPVRYHCLGQNLFYRGVEPLLAARLCCCRLRYGSLYRLKQAHIFLDFHCLFIRNSQRERFQRWRLIMKGGQGQSQ